jgi:CheY-like chemotaxis protein
MTEMKKYRFLVADDNPINIKVTDFILKPAAQLIDYAVNGEQVVEKFLANEYDVILMDVKMPVMDGYEATKRIRREEEKKQSDKKITIIATTANNQPEEAEYCKSVGMNELVAKPFNLSDILSIIE